MNKKNRDNNAGFTLVEIIVTLVILAIVAAFTVPALGGFIEDAHARDCQAKRTDLAKAYTTQLVDDGVANPGSTIDITNMETVLQAKGAVGGDGIETAALDTQSDDAGVITYGQYTGLCPDGGVYAIKTKPAAAGGQVVFYLECSKHGVVDVCQGADALSVVSIRITKTPTKTIYNKGEEFTAAGGEIEVTFKDKDGKQTTKTITMTNAMCSKPDMQQVGDNQSVTVSYGGKTASFTIDVKENIQLTALSIITPPTKTTYYVGESFNPAGMVVTATYSDGSQKPVTDYTITTPDKNAMQSTGTKDIGVSYTEGNITKTATWQSITVKLVQVRIVDANGGMVKEYTDTVSGDSTALKQAVKDVKDNQTIQIVVADYRLNPDVQVNPAGGGDEGISISKNVTITTAQDIVGGPSRIYTNSQTASNLFQVKDSNATLTLDNIVLDGGNTGENSSGATCRVAYVSKGKVVVTGATIKNFTLSKTNLFYGGAFALKTEGELSIKGSTIENCTINSAGGTGEIISNGGAIAAGGTALVTLGEGTVIRGCSAQYGGALSVVTETNKSSTTPVTLDGAKIENCTAVNQGGAINLISNSSLNITGTSITSCSSPTGAVYAGGASTTLGGTVQITENSQPVEGEDPSPCNLYLPGNKNLTIAEGGLTETASIGVTMENKTREANGQQFATAAEEKAQNVNTLYADTNVQKEAKDQYYGFEVNNKRIVWRNAAYVAVCQLRHGEDVIPFDGDTAIQDALTQAVDGDRIEMLVPEYTVKAQVSFTKNITLTKVESLDSVTLTNGITGTEALFKVYTTGKTITIKDLTLKGNPQNKDSRALFQTSGTVIFENVIMDGFGNQSNVNKGGAIYSKNSTLTIEKSAIKNCEDNSDKAAGGAIYLEKTKATLRESRIEGCTASGSGGSGGAVYSKDAVGSLTISDSTISGCSAVQFGGGITTFQTPLTITESIIDNCACTATTSSSGNYTGGGAIRIATVTQAKIENSKISNCFALYGGAISGRGSTITIGGSDAEKANITGCHGQYGVLDCDSGTLTLQDNLTISGNNNDQTWAILTHSGQEKAKENATINIGDNVKIQNNIIAGSETTGIVGGGTTPQIITVSGNVEIKGNQVTQGAGGIYVNEKSTLNVTDNVQITKNTSGAEGSKNASNVFLKGTKYLNVTADLGTSAKIGVTAEDRMSNGQQFGTLKTTSTTVPEGCFTADTEGLYGVAEGTNIKWANSIKSIAFKSDGSKYLYPKTVYKTGEDFSTDEGKLTATYSDGKTYDIDLSAASCSGYDLSKAGAQTVVVTYKGVTTTYSIIVQEAPPEDDSAKKCIQKLANMLYGENYGPVYWNACTFYNGLFHGNNRNTGAVINSKQGSSSGWFSDKCVYGNTNSILASAADISDINSQYVWAVVPNSRDGGYEPNGTTSNADDYGYTIIWCETNGLTGSKAIQSGKSYKVMVYDTKQAGYRTGQITAAKSSNFTYLNTATLTLTDAE
ncbi:bacterial Ig-like domain-containing protein [Eubacterium barkeri]|uniref:Prepilin-type N-terminal cleavage/methylation domain-containing protein n=1 Tax=Eubacterium barkeri TaxID=1528 RepID=A0A1H3AYC9_EUBBA|nr:bacterial Ig-like domain-containing protein [Eubacterium barkeri]SDX34124.1 prepilin-type N-terminal cleavage/methylation domain-containing protein [Eubacterium barkeri]